MINAKHSNKYWRLGIVGISLIIFSILFIIFQLAIYCFNKAFCVGFICSELTYISLFNIPIGFGLFLRFLYRDYALEERRKVESSELEMLYSEAEMYNNSGEGNNRLVDEVEKLKGMELKKLEFVSELDALPLRQSLVDAYPKEDLISKAINELSYFDDNLPSNDAESRYTYERWEDRIYEGIDMVNEKETGGIEKLRADLKCLRETVAFYDKAWAKGEIHLNIINYWSTVSAIILSLIGLMPLIHPHIIYAKIGIVEWIFFGLSGALLSSIIYHKDNYDVTEIGEQEGKQLLSQAVIKMAMGALTAILLYAALLGGILDGTFFPQELPIYVDPHSINQNEFWFDIGRSIFWAILSGYSVRIFYRLVNVGDKSSEGAK